MSQDYEQLMISVSTTGLIKKEFKCLFFFPSCRRTPHSNPVGGADAPFSWFANRKNPPKRSHHVVSLRLLLVWGMQWLVS